MIDTIVNRFQTFRNRLFSLFQYRADATMDLIDAVAAEDSSTSIVKISLSSLFRRTYSSITDVLDSLFKSGPETNPNVTTRADQALAVTRLLVEEIPEPQGAFVQFAIDCTAHPRLYAKKVSDRGIVHAPNHVPGQKPITVGHAYSVLVHIPDYPTDRKLHWVMPLSVRRVSTKEMGTRVGLAQFAYIVTQPTLRDRLCVNVSDTAYSHRDWLIGIHNFPNAVNIARLRGNRLLYRMPVGIINRRRGRPVLYGEEVPLSAPPTPDEQETITITTSRGEELRVHLTRWNDLLAKGTNEDKTHQHPFDIVRAIVTNSKGKQVFKRPLWLMISGERSREISMQQAFIAYRHRYDIEHYFRFGKQRLLLVSSQTSETQHEEHWHWIALLAYTMLYRASALAKEVRNPWEKYKIRVVQSKQAPSTTQRDYERIIRGIGTPASMPKPRGKSTGRRAGVERKQRFNQAIICKASKSKEEKGLKRRQKSKKRQKRVVYRRIRRRWRKARKEQIYRINVVEEQ
jgi:hypothetical protein